MQISEHTWGVDTKEFPGDYSRWKNQDFHQALRMKEENDTSFQIAVESWVRQRAYLKWAVEELSSGGSSNEGGLLAQKAQEILQVSQNIESPLARINTSQYEVIEPSNLKNLDFSSKFWRLRFDESTGAISGLTFLGKKSKISSPVDGILSSTCPGCQNWASATALLSNLVYSTFDEASYDVIWQHYAHRTTPFPDWFLKDFGKPNATSMGGARRLDAVPVLKKAWHQDNDKDSLHVVLEAAFDKGLVRHAGAPAAVYYEITSPSDSDDLFIDVILENKTATRLPEALWLRWEPALSAVDSNSWVMSKLGSWISPLEVIRNGSMGMHAVDDGGVAVRSADGAAVLSIRSLDAALVSPGSATPFPSVVTLPDLSKGMHFNLVNNIWGTNYVMWFPYDEVNDSTMRFRFVVQVDQSFVAVQ